MAALFYYGGTAAATYFVGRNVLGRVTNNALDYVFNTNANSEIKHTHVVNSITGMLKSYRTMSTMHPAYEAMMSVREGLQKLEQAIQQAIIRREVFQNGYLTRFRTYDASHDNKKIQMLTDDLMERLEVFSTIKTNSDSKS